MGTYVGIEGGTIAGYLVISGLSREESIRSGSLVYEIQAHDGSATYGELLLHVLTK